MRHGRRGLAHLGDAEVTPTLAPIAVTTEQIVRRMVDAANHPSRLNRRVVRDLDAVIAACEQLHLIGRERMTVTVYEPAVKALASADEFLAAAGETSPVRDISARSKIITVLDAVYAMQELVFDVLIPERHRYAAEDDAHTLHRTSGEGV
jgi:hypothetical protein